jgi:hypothetical protein
MKARYPFTKAGKPDDLANGDSFDLPHFVDACEAVLDELTTLREQIGFGGSYSDYIEEQVNGSANREEIARSDD